MNAITIDSKRYKFLRADGQRIQSENGDVTWQLDQWQEGREDLAICERGFHCCRDIYSAFMYVQGEVLAEVEVGGHSIADPDDDKEVWQRMRIVHAWRWTKRDSVALTAMAAGLVLANYEQVYPDDARPRQAIESARRWMTDPTGEHEVAAQSAAESAAWSVAESAGAAARSAGAAAWSAARSARSAARAAWSARSAAEFAGSAVESAARSAAWSATESAARSAARSAVRQEIARWMDDHLAELEQMPAQKAS